jgi:hypothetical protein
LSFIKGIQITLKYLKNSLKKRRVFYIKIKRTTDWFQLKITLPSVSGGSHCNPSTWEAEARRSRV